MNSPRPDLSKMIKITDDFYQYPKGFIDSGKFGKVFQGWSQSRQKNVAIKELIMKQLTPASKRQIQILKELSKLDRKNVVKFYGDYHDQKADQIYIFLEYCPFDLKSAILFGREKSESEETKEKYYNLSQSQIEQKRQRQQKLPKTIETILKKKKLDELQILHFFKQLLQGMGQIHAQGQMHRDLKPQNILISEDCNLKISDFGLAKKDLNIFQTGRKGTLIYTAPQVILKKQYKQNCEVWNVGLILYEMLTGKLFFNDVINIKQLKQAWKNVEIGVKYASYDQQVFHPLWEYFTNLMLTYDHNKRPSFNELLDTLKLVYDKMERQIKSRKLEQTQDLRLQALENFLKFEMQKSNVLRKTYGQMAKRSIQIPEPVRFMIMFLCHSKYLKHMSDLFSSLSSHQIRLPNTKDWLGMENYHNNQNHLIPKAGDDVKVKNMRQKNDLIMCMERYRKKIEIKCTYVSYELRGYVVGQLKSCFKNFSLDWRLLDESKQRDLIKLVEFVSSNRLDHEDAYTDALKLVVSSCISVDKSSLKTYSHQTLRALFWVMLATRLDEEFPDNSYLQDNQVQNNIKKLDEQFIKNPTDWISQIFKLIQPN